MRARRTLDRPGRHNKPHVHESAAVKLTSYPGTVCHLVVTGLGRDAPTVIITNDRQITTKALIESDQPVGRAGRECSGQGGHRGH